MGMYGEFASHKTSSSLTRLALRFQAVPSRPRTIIPANEDHFLNCVYPHLPQDDLSLCSAKKTPSPQRGQFWRRLCALSSLTSLSPHALIFFPPVSWFRSHRLFRLSSWFRSHRLFRLSSWFRSHRLFRLSSWFRSHRLFRLSSWFRSHRLFRLSSWFRSHRLFRLSSWF